MKRMSSCVIAAAGLSEPDELSSLIGGTRTVCPSSSRTFAFARLPSTRTWPERRSFWSWPCFRSG